MSQTNPKCEYRLTSAVYLNPETANTLLSRIVWILDRPDFGSLTVLFSGEGGSTDQSIALFTFLRSLPVRIHMHGVGHIGSAAVPVFLAGHTRSCAPLARFFFHEYDWTFAGPQTLHRIREASERLRNDIEAARQIVKAHTNAGDDILNTFDGTAAPAVLTAHQAKASGFVEQVCELGETSGDGAPVRMCVV
jgi:ATP-dependent protease ClpP protease subunit